MPDPESRPHVTEPGGDTATIRIGLKNVLGSNWTTGEHAWQHRESRLERELLGRDGMRAGVYFFLEVNRGPERASLKRILHGWDVVRTRGHNDVYSDPGEHRLLAHHELPLGTTTGQERYATIVRWEHLSTGLVWTAATTHLSSSVNTTVEKATASRTLQATELVRLCKQFDIDVLAADLNNIVVRPDSPRGILEAAGYRDWRSVVPVENADHDTHHELGVPPLLRGKHLDAIYLGERVTPLDGRLQVTEPDSSDHFGLVCTLSIGRGADRG